MNFKRAVRLSFEGVDVDPITDLSIIFNADKADGEQMNSALITIFNLSPSSRASLVVARPARNIGEASPIKCRLFAGYEDNLKEIIAGDLFLSNSTKDGENWVTTLEIYSGIYSANKARHIASYDGKTNAKFILNNMLAPLKISILYTEKASEIMKNKTYFDFSESGMVWRSATVFLKSMNLGFTIEEDGIGLVYELDSPREKDAPRTSDNAFNQGNGLIGSPKVTATGAEIVSLLRPEIQLRQSIYIESKTIGETLQKDELLSNKYYVKSVRHQGDTHSDDWFTFIEAYYADLQTEFITNV